MGGFTVKKALIYNTLVNCSCVIGSIIGLAVGSVNDEIAGYFLLWCAGNFLYIALADMTPFLN